MMELEITVSYAQLCVFDPAIEAPYNDWTDAHVAQGFSWRPGSVSFATDGDGSPIVVHVTSAEGPPVLFDANSAIRVPFVVSPSGAIEVGSVMSGIQAAIPPGRYALYFLTPSAPSSLFRLIFVPAEEVEPAVLKEGRNAKMQLGYLMTAAPA